jgi:ribonuclease HII
MDGFEKKLWGSGFSLIAGVDEAGRGALAGPVVAAAVILPKGARNFGLKDSKKLSPARREALFEEIKKAAVSIGIGIVEAEEIDRVNILRATLKAMDMAVSLLKPPPDYILVDGNQTIKSDIPQEAIVKGDDRSISIAAASIMAKVTRDRIMTSLHERYPGYNFHIHKGYGTKGHRDAIKRCGLSPVHRKSFTSGHNDCEQLHMFQSWSFLGFFQMVFKSIVETGL